MNLVELEGVISRLKRFDKVIKFTLITEDYVNKEGKAFNTYHNCVAFGECIDLLSNYGDGDNVGLKGQYKNNNTEKDGVKQYGMQLVISNVSSNRRKELKTNNYKPNRPEANELESDDIPF